MKKPTRRNSFFWGTLLTAVVAIAYLSVRTKQTEPPVPPPLPATATLPPKQLARAREVFQGKRSALPESANPSISLECRKLWNELREIDVILAFSSPAGAMLLPEKRPGCTAVPPEMTDTHEYYANLCGSLKTMDPKTTPKEVWDRTRQGCYAVATVYRAQITEFATKDIPLGKISDPKILADKAIARFVSNPATSADAADRLLEVEPDLSPAARLSALGRFLHARAEQGKEGGDKVWDRAESALARAKQQAPEAALEIEELEIWTEASRSGDPGAIRSRAEEMIQAHPKSGMGYFFVSYAEFKAGNWEKMKDAMKQATLVDPSPRYQEALQRIEATPDGKNPGIFNSQRSFPLDELIPPA